MSSAPTQSAMAELERAALRVWRKISAPGAPCRVVVSVGSAGPSVVIEPALIIGQPDSPAPPAREVDQFASRIKSRAARSA